MIDITITEDGAALSFENTVSDSVMFEKISFNFPPSWNGYAKTAVFKNGGTTVSVVLDSDSILCTGDNECYVPYEVIKAPEFTVSVFGVLGNSRVTSTQTRIWVKQSGYGEGDVPPAPTPSEYEQLLSLANETKEIALSVRDDSEAAITSANTAASKANKSADSANAAAANANEAASSAESSASTADTAAANANTAATEANTAAEKAETAASDANAATVNADSAAGNANTEAANAKAAATAANNAASAATNAAESANTAASDANEASSAANKAAMSANSATELAQSATASANTAAENAVNAKNAAEEAISNANNATERANTAAVNAESIVTQANTTFANALKGSKSGAALLISDVSPVTHDMGVKVRSKNLIPYPFIYRTFEHSGITFTDNKDGTITLNGQNDGSGISNYNLFQSVDKLSFLKPNTDYYLSCNLDNIIRSLRTVKSDGTYNYYTYGNINFSSDETPDRLFIQIKSTDTTTYDNTIVKLQIELGTTPTDYTPYVDLTAVKVKKQGKNLLPPADSGIYYQGSITSAKPFIAYSSYGISDFNNIDVSINRGVYAVIKLTEGETYTLTINNLVNNCATKQIHLTVGFRSSESTIFGTSETGNSVSSGYNQSSLTFTVPSGYPYCLVGFYNYPTVSGDTISFNAMQLELSAEATDYEPYITPTEYTPNADGTVDGVTSLYPNTTLTTDTEGALIDCEYNRDINKAFAEMQSAIISMGGNV